MKLIKSNKALIIIFLCALFIRSIFLDKFPLGFHADEVRVGWNAYSILKTDKDDRGNILALYYNTFGDYRPTGIFYITIPSIFIFGVSEFAVRFPSAFIGALTVFPLFFLTKEITKNKSVAYLSVIFLAFTPWHWIVSRATSEGIISLFFGIIGVLLFIYALKTNKTALFIGTFLSFVLSSLFYHSIRPITPFFLFTILASYWNKSLPEAHKKGVITLLCGTVFVIILLSGKGSLSRFQQVSVAEAVNPYAPKTSNFIKIRDQYLDYLSFDFLIADFPRPFRYRVFGVSILGSSLSVLLLVGVLAIIQKKYSKLLLYLLLLSPIPAAVTSEDSPNLHRAIFMLPFILMIAAVGAVNLASGKFKSKILVVVLFIAFGITSISNIFNYLGEGTDDAAPYRNYGAVELITEVDAIQKNYDHIFFTNKPDSPYPWYAFLNKLDPKEFNAHAILRTQPTWDYKNITFTTNSCPSADAFDVKTGTKGLILAIDGADCEKNSILNDIPGTKIIKEITNPDGSVVYRLWERSS